MISREDLQARVEAIAAEAKVTGISVGLSIGDESIIAHHGIANVETGLPVRADTLFGAGSVTKVFTSTLLMTVVDDGLLDLDEPIVSHLPEFKMNDASQAGLVTARVLLTHAAGLPGYCMWGLRTGPNVLARAMQILNTYSFNSPPGRFSSYSNGSMLVAGRLTEVLTGRTWDEAFDERILTPLGCHGTTITERMILESTAVGHRVDLATEQAERLDMFQLDGGNGPAGTSFWCDVDAFLRFGRMHLRQGMGPNGTRVLSEDSAREMQTPQAPAIWSQGGDWGLGWHLRDASGTTIPSHGGGNAGMNSMLSVVPAHDAVIAILTNSMTGAMVIQRLTDELLSDLFGITASPPQAAPAQPIEVDLSLYTGRYVADECAVDVAEREGKLIITHDLEPRIQKVMENLLYTFPPPPLTLTPFDADGRFISDLGLPVPFLFDDRPARAEYVGVGRYYRRES